jgi:hypothetical protein
MNKRGIHTYAPPMLRCLFACLLATCAYPAEIVVRDAAELQGALRGLKNGTTLKLAPGDYPGNHHVAGVDKLTIEALDPKQPPHFKGGANAWQFSRCAGLTLRNLRVSGQTGNGFNIDDGGEAEGARGITLERLEISDIGPKGNHDGIKCSGLIHLTVRDCVITGWGGQGIDCVGCHHVLITGCRFIGKEGFTATAGVQLKGGSSESTVEKCHFENGGERPVNVGGSTNPEYIRPLGAKFEAAKITVRDNVMEGSSCAAAFVGVHGAHFTGNTVLYPNKWIFRILRENQDPSFAPSQNVFVRNNKIIFRRAQVQVDVNIGPGTSPETFHFEKNKWFAEDHPSSSKPRLPVEEKDGVYGSDPL